MSDEPKNIIARVRVQLFVGEFLVFTDAEKDDPADAKQFAAFVNSAICDSQEEWGDITVSLPELVQIQEKQLSIQVEPEGGAD